MSGQDRGDEGNEHAVPLLSNQETSEDPHKSLDDDYHVPNLRASFIEHSRTFSSNYFPKVTSFYQIYRRPFLFFLCAVVVALLFIKLYFGNGTSERFISIRHKVPSCLRYPAPSPLDSKLTELKPAYFTNLGARRVRIKYGPYEVPMSTIHNGMASFMEKNSTKPCEDCLITFIQAGLEYADGSYANADSGMWLHHVVQVDTEVDDTVCGRAVVQRPLAPNRFFASGNERSAAHLCAQG
jgi:hypothetical protein